MLLLLMFALLAGVILPVQAGVNAQLRATLGSPLAAALVSFVVGTAGLLGAATLVAAVVAGQMLTSVVLDQYGLIGLPAASADSRASAGSGTRHRRRHIDSAVAPRKRSTPSILRRRGHVPGRLR